MAADTETTARKTFRLEPDAAQVLTDAGRQYATENAAINGLLREVPKLRKKLAENDIFHNQQKQQIAEANGVARDWKDKYDAKCAELQALQNALALVGKFLRPADL